MCVISRWYENERKTVTLKLGWSGHWHFFFMSRTIMHRSTCVYMRKCLIGSLTNRNIRRLQELRWFVLKRLIVCPFEKMILARAKELVLWWPATIQRQEELDPGNVNVWNWKLSSLPLIDYKLVLFRMWKCYTAMVHSSIRSEVGDIQKLLDSLKIFLNAYHWGSSTSLARAE